MLSNLRWTLHTLARGVATEFRVLGINFIECLQSDPIGLELDETFLRILGKSRSRENQQLLDLLRRQYV